jgi:Amino acid synthesis
MMTIRKTVTLVEEINSEYGAPASPPLRRVAIAAVFENPLAGKAAGADLQPLIDYSLELGGLLTKAALATLGASPAQLRAYTKAALVGTGGDLEHGAAMLHPRLGMAMRRAIKRQGRPAGHDSGSHLRAPRRRLGSRCFRFDPGADP